MQAASSEGSTRSPQRTDGAPLAWGVLGTGWVAQRFVSDLRRVPGTQLCAIGSRDLERAAQLATQLGVDRAHGSYESLVSDPHVDVVYVATESHLHVQHCRMALEAKKHVLCEKPMALAEADVEELSALARAKGCFLMEAMWTRFLPAVREAKRLVDSGTLGDPRLFTADFGTSLARSEHQRLFQRERAGGAFFDRGCYPLSLAIWLFGEPLASHIELHRGPTGVDETAVCQLRFRSDRFAQLSASMVALSANEGVIAGSHGRLTLHEPLARPDRLTVAQTKPQAGTSQELRKGRLARAKQQLSSRLRASPWLQTLRADCRSFPVQGHGYGYQAHEVVRCVQQGMLESPSMPLHESRLAARILQQVTERLSQR